MPDTPRKLRIIDSPDPERPPAGPEPAREKLRLGAKEFADVNRAHEVTTAPISVKEILATNLAKTAPVAPHPGLLAVPSVSRLKC